MSPYRKASSDALNVRRRAWFDSVKDAPCMDCGGTFPPECMDFDHVRGEKKVKAVGDLLRCSLVVRLTEIAKCDLVCANCHRIRTRKRRKA